MSDTPPASAADCMELLRTLGSVHKAMRTRLGPTLADGYGIDVHLFLVMRQIQAGVAHPGDLARESMEPPSQISRRLDKLETLGLVRRTLDPEDSRRIRLALTEPGRALLAAVDDRATAALAPALAALDPERRRALIESLNAIAARLAGGPA